MAAAYFFSQAEKLFLDPDFSPKERLVRQNDLLVKLFLHVTRNENLQFTTLFARIAFVAHQRQFSRTVQWHVQWFRKRASLVIYQGLPEASEDCDRGLQALAEAISGVFHEPVPESLRALLPKTDVFPAPVTDIVRHKDQARVYVTNILEAEHFLVGFDQDQPAEPIRVKYGHPSLNEVFDPSIQQLQRVLGGRGTVNLLNVSIDSLGVYYPESIILEPDYLLDVTAVAECFSGSFVEPVTHLVKKFVASEPTPAMMLGNVANFFLDELMNEPDADFRDVFKKLFRLYPLGFTVLDDREVIEMREKSQRHFATIQQLVKQGFAERKISRDSCYLEPSFYAERYGIQGRLDVLFREGGPEGRSAIIELKSGKPFSPNTYGLSVNHYIQTLLYDLILRAVFGKNIQPETYLLYSGLEIDALKYVPPIPAQQQEALQVRNQLLAYEWALCRLDEGPLDRECLFDRMNTAHFPKLFGFSQAHLADFAATWAAATPLERKYFRVFVAFTAREHLLARTGVEGNDQLNGLASLWLNPLRQKQDNFEALAWLRVSDHKSGEEEPTVTMVYTEKSNLLTNFRVGDIAVLYPIRSDGDTVLGTQIFKCTVTVLDKGTVAVRLRFKQFNRSLFDNNELFWVLEHDSMDNSFNAQYKGLFAFLKAPSAKRRLLIGLEPPGKQTAETFGGGAGEALTEEQARILAKAIAAPDYFLLLGPPGTGKTKFMLRHFVRHILENTDEQLLLLAYTNRAVDEICDAIHDFADEHFLRIGSESSAGSEWAGKMLKNHIASVGNRKELREVLDKHRIFVSTLASLQSNLDLLRLKKFSRVVLDEASQVLEPMLVGLLSQFERFVLIGDHKQLPAVVLQDKERSAVNDADLLQIGLHNRRNSLFERLYLHCKEKKWDWAYDMLGAQGRMHRDIAAYPSHHFYEGKLALLPSSCDPGQWQSAHLPLHLPDEPTALERKLCERRFLYFPTPVDRNGSAKTNRYEAKLMAELVLAYEELYLHSELEWAPEKVGIITPFRAQIALIRDELLKINPDYERVTVDTVERYQGGARDIILISLCMNAPYQLQALVSLSDDGETDRKLNVALTRARHHLVVVGNRDMLMQSPVYQKLLQSFSD